MKNILIVLLMCFTMGVSHSQNCNDFFPIEEGMTQIFKSYNGKGKLTASSEQTYSSVSRNGNDLKATIETVAYDKKGEEVSTGTLEMSCADGVVRFDMRGILSDEMTEMFNNMDVVMDGDHITVPGELSVGQELPDATMTLRSEGSGPAIVNVTFNITNRKVTAKEKITTEAGTYECFVLEYDMQMKWLLNKTFSVKQYIAKNKGIVRTENYTKSGKLSSYTDLATK